MTGFNSTMLSSFICGAAVSEFFYFLRLNNIPLDVYTFSVTIHLLMDTTCFHLLTAVNTKYCYEHVLISFLLSIYPEMGMLDFMVILCLLFHGIYILLHSGCSILENFHCTSIVQWFQSFPIISNSCSFSANISTLKDMKYCFIVF